MEEQQALTAFAAIRADLYGTWTGPHLETSTVDAVTYVSAPECHTLEAVAQALELGRAAQEVVIRVPAMPHASYAFALFEAHNALAFWKGRHDARCPGTMIGYLGSRPWEFSRALRDHAAVFVRGFGAAGPWTAR